MPSPGAGQLDQVITIQQRIGTRDSHGGMVDTWTDFAANIWAKANHLSGNERAATRQGGDKLEARTEFTLYWMPGITNTMRIVLDGVYYNIRHVNNFMNRNEYLIVTCDTGGRDGR